MIFYSGIRNNLIFFSFITYVLAINTDDFCKKIPHEIFFKGLFKSKIQIFILKLTK